MWKTHDRPLFPWAKSFDKIIASARPTAIAGPAFFIASDSSGTDAKSRYRVTAYLCFGFADWMLWEVVRRDFRSRHLRDGRRMSFKALSDRRRRAVLKGFLGAALNMSGLCFVVITNRAIRHLCLPTGEDYNRLRETASLQSRWKDRELEEAVRTTYTVALLVGGMSQPNQTVTWLSDEDNLFSNERHSLDVARLLGNFTEHHVKHPLGARGIGTTALDEGDRAIEDIVAIPDLVAGAVAEMANAVADACGGRIPNNLAIDYTGKVSPKSDLISSWLWEARGQLARVVARIDTVEQGSYAVSKWDMALP